MTEEYEKKHRFYDPENDTYAFRGKILCAYGISRPGRPCYESGPYELSPGEDCDGNMVWCASWDDDPYSLDNWAEASLSRLSGEGATPEEALCALDAALTRRGVTDD